MRGRCQGKDGATFAGGSSYPGYAPRSSSGVPNCWPQGGVGSDVSAATKNYSHIERSRFGTSNREPQEYGMNMMGVEVPGSLHSHQIPTLFLGFAIWGPHFSAFTCDPQDRYLSELEACGSYDCRNVVGNLLFSEQLLMIASMCTVISLGILFCFYYS